MREPLWLDFGQPEGVNTFLRYVRKERVVILYPPLIDRDEQGFTGQEGCYEAEFYAELAAGTDLKEEDDPRTCPTLVSR